MREQQLNITLSITGHNSHDSGISVLHTVWSGIVRYVTYPTPDSRLTNTYRMRKLNAEPTLFCST